MLHLLAFALFGPAVEFVLQLFVGSLWLFSQEAFSITELLNCKLNTNLHALYATLTLRMAPSPLPAPQREPELLYCPTCGEEVSDPLTCGDCSAVICRRCGTPLESSDELGIG